MRLAPANLADRLHTVIPPFRIEESVIAALDSHPRRVAATMFQPEKVTTPLHPEPWVSVIILNYNGAAWLECCLRSLRAQTIFDQIEVIVADNASPDNSDRLAADLMRDWPNACVVQHGENLGFCEGNNRAAAQARGKWLFFLNNDVWLESDCLETLVRETEAANAQAACPLVMDYDSQAFQSLGAAGFDLFGLASTRKFHQQTRRVFMPEGCAYLIRADVFRNLRGFDAEFFMFSDEYDLSWRLWVAGYAAVAVPSAKMHHRGAAQVNPAGGGTVVEFRTSDRKRFYANRNGLLLLLKNAQGPLLVLAGMQLLYLLVEGLLWALLLRRWSFFRRAYWEAGIDLWRLRAHIRAERRYLGALRARGDLWMLRFLRLRLNRWDEMLRIRRMGLPRVTGG